MRENSGQPIPPQSFSFLTHHRSPFPLAIRLCLNQSTAELSTTLAGRQMSDLLGSGLGDLLVGLSEDELDVAGLAHVGVDLEKVSENA